jgi:peptidoglycan/xylan/chitin deacetylase (PgdA/CDA1 family)
VSSSTGPRTPGVALLDVLASVTGLAARLSVLIYHRVHRAPDPMFPGEVDAQTFRWQLEQISRYFNVLPLAEAVERLRTRSLPARAVAITFDDGYADNEEVALPILQQFKLPATFFVASGFLDGGIMWNDRIIEAVRRYTGPRLDLMQPGLGCYALDSDAKRSLVAEELIAKLKHRPTRERDHLTDAIVEASGITLPRNLMMRSEQVRRLTQVGMEIGGHTVNHPILAMLSDIEARDEIANGRARLEAITGERVRLFAYPNGKPGQDYGPSHVAMAKALGFVAALSTAWGVATVRSDLHQLPRFTPWDRTPRRFSLRLAQNWLRAQRERV